MKTVGWPSGVMGFTSRRQMAALNRPPVNSAKDHSVDNAISQVK
jgi:hypothetical protein